MHTIQIIWFLMWPVSIYIAYRAVLFALKRFEKKLAGKNQEQSVLDS
jgi:hypothetical protein